LQFVCYVRCDILDCRHRVRQRFDRKVMMPNTALEATRTRAVGLRVSVLVGACTSIPGASAFGR
jgi:hypothetical protein